MTEQYFSVSNSERLDMTGVTTVRRKYERMYAKITKSGCVDVGEDTFAGSRQRNAGLIGLSPLKPCYTWDTRSIT